MCNNLKMADRRAKWMNKFGTQGTTVHICSTFDARFLEFGLGSFAALGKISNVKMLKRLLLPRKYVGHVGIRAGVIVIAIVFDCNQLHFFK